MKVYIKIEQTKGTGDLQIRFLDSINSTLWYKDGDVVYMDINETDLRIESKLIASTSDSNTVELTYYDELSDEHFYTATVSGSSISDTIALTCTTTSIDLGSDKLSDPITSSNILVTAENLEGEYIIIDGNYDNSFWFSGNGTSYFQGKLPLSSITWVTSTTFNLKIRRHYLDFYGKNSTILTFTNGSASFDITVKSNFTNEQQLESGLWEKGSANDSVKQINNLNSNSASGINSIAMGSNTTASGTASHAEGRSTSASGTASHSEGSDTTSTGLASHSEGDESDATGDNSHAEGFNTTASGTSSHAEGRTTIASGLTSHAEGFETNATGYGSHAEGEYTTASGTVSHAEGRSTSATGLYGSHAEGRYTTASGGSGSHSGDLLIIHMVLLVLIQFVMELQQ